MQEEFSQDWIIYRVVTHETQPCKRWELDSHISYQQLLDMLEIVEAYDAMKKVAFDRAEQKAKQNNK